MNAGSAPLQPLYLIDASLYVFRAWHSIPDEFQDAQGWPVNAVHGFARFLLDLLERERVLHPRPQLFAVVARELHSLDDSGNELQLLDVHQRTLFSPVEIRKYWPRTVFSCVCVV